MTSFIIDSGAYTCKFGFSDEIAPRQIPTAYGVPKRASFHGLGFSNNRYGSEIDSPLYEKKYVYQDGFVRDWTELQNIWHHIFSAYYDGSQNNHNVLITDSSKNIQTDKEKIAKIMFETFRVPGLYIANQSFLSLLCFGKTTGLVCNSGYEITSFAPIVNGELLPHSQVELNVAGKDVTDNLIRLLGYENGVYLNSTREKGFANEKKEEICYVSLNPREERCNPQSIELIDGNVIQVTDVKFQAPEVLFHPELVGKERGGIATKLCDSISRGNFNPDVQRSLYSNIYLTGGTTMFRGLAERLSQEIRGVCPEAMRDSITVNSLPQREKSAWIGGCILSSRLTDNNLWITRADYEERGAQVLNRNLNIY